MIIETYVLFWVIALLSMLISFLFKTDEGWILFLPFISVIFFSILAVASFDIHKTECEVCFNTGCANPTWSCKDSQIQDPYVGYTAGGFAIIMLLFALINIFNEPVKELAKGQGFQP